MDSLLNVASFWLGSASASCPTVYNCHLLWIIIRNDTLGSAQSSNNLLCDWLRGIWVIMQVFRSVSMCVSVRSVKSPWLFATQQMFSVLPGGSLFPLFSWIIQPSYMLTSCRSPTNNHTLSWLPSWQNLHHHSVSLQDAFFSPLGALAHHNPLSTLHPSATVAVNLMRHNVLVCSRMHGILVSPRGFFTGLSQEWRCHPLF